MDQPISLSAEILEDILLYTTYFDTLRLSSILNIQLSSSFWQYKYEVEWDKKMDKSVIDTQLYFLRHTSRIGGKLVGLANFPYTIFQIQLCEDVIWILTSEGTVYSILLRDSDAVWSKADLSRPATDLWVSADDRLGYTAYVDNGQILKLKAVNREYTIVDDMSTINLRTNRYIGAIITKESIIFPIQTSRLANTIKIVSPDSGSGVIVEMSEVPLPLRAINTSKLLDISNPTIRIDDDFDRETDIISEFEDTDQGMIESINTI